MIGTGENDLSVPGAVGLSREWTEVESGSRPLEDVMAVRPISHQLEARVPAPIFVAALAPRVRRLRGRRLREAGVDLSPVRALRAWATVRLVPSPREGRPDRRGLTGGGPDARLVLKALERIDPRPPVPPAGEETVW